MDIRLQAVEVACTVKIPAQLQQHQQQVQNLQVLIEQQNQQTQQQVQNLQVLIGQQNQQTQQILQQLQNMANLLVANQVNVEEKNTIFRVVNRSLSQEQPLRGILNAAGMVCPTFPVTKLEALGLPNPQLGVILAFYDQVAGGHRVARLGRLLAFIGAS